MTQYLSKNEKRKLLDLIDRGLVCKSEEDFKTHLLSPLVELIGTEIGLSIWGNPSKGKVDGAIDLNFPEEYVNLYLHHFFEDPAFRLWLSKQEPFIFSPKGVSKSHNNCIAANFDLRTRNGIFHGLAECRPSYRKGIGDTQMDKGRKEWMGYICYNGNKREHSKISYQEYP